MVARLAVASLLVACTSGRAAAEDPAVERACADVANVGFRASDRPSAEEVEALSGCDAEALYYGIGREADPAKARACSFVQVDAGDESLFGGSNILMMVYATGKGAKQDLRAATAVACRTSHAPAERQARVRHLLALGSPPLEFDLCDDVTSGFMQGACAAHAERLRDVARARRRSAAAAAFPDAARKELTALEAAAARYFEARVQNEVDLSGTARAALSIAERAALEDGFVELLERAARRDPPPATAGAFAAADAALNAVYRRLMKRPPVFGDSWWGTVKPAGIGETQRAWLAYRDAWGRFGTALAAGSSPDAWLALLTRQRVEVLVPFDRD